LSGRALSGRAREPCPQQIPIIWEDCPAHSKFRSSGKIALPTANSDHLGRCPAHSKFQSSGKMPCPQQIPIIREDAHSNHPGRFRNILTKYYNIRINIRIFAKSKNNKTI